MNQHSNEVKKSTVDAPLPFFLRLGKASANILGKPREWRNLAKEAMPARPVRQSVVASIGLEPKCILLIT